MLFTYHLPYISALGLISRIMECTSSILEVFSAQGRGVRRIQSLWSTLKKQDLVVATTTTDPKDARIQELEKENREKGKRIDELQAEIAASPETSEDIFL